MGSPVVTLPAVPGDVVVWGEDVNSQITSRPRNGGFVKIAPGGATQSLALGGNGIPVLWGGVGAGSPTMPIVPALTLTPGEKYVDIAIGVSFAAAIRASDRGIETWGSFAGPPPNSSALPPKFAGIGFFALTVGGGHGVAIVDSDRTLLQWGTGEGTEPSPKGIRFVEVRSRSDYNVALDEFGDIFGWGGHLFRPPDSGIQPVLPAPAHPLAGTDWQWVPNGYWFHKGPFRSIAAGGLQKTLSPPLPHVLALKPDGTVVGWGANTFGAITKAPKAARRSPRLRPGSLSVSASILRECSITGAIQCRSPPVQPAGVSLVFWPRCQPVPLHPSVRRLVTPPHCGLQFRPGTVSTVDASAGP